MAGWDSESIDADYELYDVDESSYQDLKQDPFLTVTYMDRSGLSGSSMNSQLSTGSYPEQNYVASPITPSYGSPGSDEGQTRRSPQYETFQNGFLSPDAAMLSRESSTGTSTRRSPQYETSQNGFLSPDAAMLSRESSRGTLTPRSPQYETSQNGFLSTDAAMLSRESSTGTSTRRSPQYETSQNGFLSPDAAMLSRESSTGTSALYDIERHGDPRIEWPMYYDFIVTETDAYFRLQPDYKPTVNYPRIRTFEKVIIINGKICHPCGVPGCEAEAFISHYDLKCHFITVHQAEKEKKGDEPGSDPMRDLEKYYNFIVTKTDAYYRLRPSYKPLVNRPSVRPFEKVIIINGEKRHPCGVLGCPAKPFTRHYDLERHFITRHQADKEKKGEEKGSDEPLKEQSEKVLMKCDYKKCSHTALLRKDHCREHYREFHTEDLIKRGQPKHSKPKSNKKKPETNEEFLASRCQNLKLGWFRCSKCIQRVQINLNGYKCPTCNLACEPERVTCRENERKRRKNASSPANSSSDFVSAEMDYVVTSCLQCENTWLPDESDESLWIPCPRCRPGESETLRF